MAIGFMSISLVRQVYTCKSVHTCIHRQRGQHYIAKSTRFTAPPTGNAPNAKVKPVDYGELAGAAVATTSLTIFINSG